MPLTLADRVVLDDEVFKYVTSSTFCNLIGAPRSWRTDSFWYRQSARPSLRVFILKELNAAGGSGLACETMSGPCGKKKIALSQVWRNFHVHRLSPTITSGWQSCLDTLQVSQAASDVSDLTLQLVLKRLMHAVVKQMTTSPSTSIRCTPHCLTNREGNAVRYMAGYVVMKLRKKYRKHRL